MQRDSCYTERSDHDHALSERRNRLTQYTPHSPAVQPRAAPSTGVPPGDTITIDREALRDLVQQLPPRQRWVVVARYGLDGQPPRTRQQIGAQLNCSAEWVRQLEWAAPTARPWRRAGRGSPLRLYGDKRRAQPALRPRIPEMRQADAGFLDSRSHARVQQRLGFFLPPALVAGRAPAGDAGVLRRVARMRQQLRHALA